MADRKEEIRTFIKNHPGCMVKDVVEHMNSEDVELKASVATTHKYLGELKSENVIKAVDDSKNRQIQRLFLNDNNLFNAFLDEINDFEQAFFKLRKVAERQINQMLKENGAKPGIKDDMDRLKALLCVSLLTFTELISYKSTVVWPLTIRDPDELKKLCGLAFKKIGDIYTKTSGDGMLRLSNAELIRIHSRVLVMTSLLNGKDPLRGKNVIEEFKINTEADALAKVLKDIIPPMDEKLRAFANSPLKLSWPSSKTSESNPASP